jgi:hypothetical protein
MSFVASPVFRKDFGLADLSGMPTKFRNLNVGRHYLELIILQFMHFCSLAIQQCQRPSESEVHLLCCLDSAWPLIEGAPYYRAIIMQWHEAFEHILIHARSTAGKADFLAATVLEFHY